MAYLKPENRWILIFLGTYAGAEKKLEDGKLANETLNTTTSTIAEINPPQNIEIMELER